VAIHRSGKPPKDLDSNMKCIKGIVVTLRANRRGQTMTEYAMILSAVAVVVYSAYQLLGTDIGVMLSNVDSLL